MTINYIAVAIAQRLEWVTEQTQEKICMAGIFHDLYVSDELAMIKSTTSKEFLELSASDKKVVLAHPELAGEVVRKFDKVSSDCNLLVYNHHENFLGTGFPRGVNASSISPLSAVFNIAHDFAHELYLHGIENKEQIIANMRETHCKLTLKKPFECLVEIISK